MAKVFVFGGRNISLFNELVEFSNIIPPKILIIPHSQINVKDGEKKIYETTKGDFHNTKVFVQYRGKNFNKWFKILKVSDLNDNQKVSDYISWADIYYVPPGDTLKMLDLWNKTGFSEILKEASSDNKIFAGYSAGANCWFSSFTTQTSEGLEVGQGLNIVNAHMTSHGDDSTIRDFHQSLINEKNVLGFCMVKDTALAVDGDNYKIIVPRRRGRFNEEINFPFITQY